MKPIERISVTDSVVDSIKELILSKKYEVGDKLPTELNFCQMLGVSRTTVREGIRVLQAMGYIQLIPGKGAFVAKNKEDSQDMTEPIDINDISYMDFMDIRLAIEPVAVRLAVVYGTDKQIQELEEIQESFISAVETKNIVKMTIGDDVFHKQIFKMSANKLLININKEVSEVYLQYRQKSFKDMEVYRNALAPHNMILDNIKKRNVQGAIEAMEIHMKMAVRDMNKMFGN